MLELFSRVRRSLLFFNLQVAEVTYFVAKLSDPAIEFCNSERGWTEFDLPMPVILIPARWP